MIRVSTKPTALLAALLLLGTAVWGQGQPWPLKRTIDLSSGFGDIRVNRFHAGVDLRTGGEIGAEVYSPVDGYVWRVKMSYRGYGKGLYVKAEDDHLYVFGHLSGFSKMIETAVREHQFHRERYYADIYFREDSLPIKRGQLIGYSGQSGVGAPHLHFEKRSPDNVPINPLTHGFELADRTPPTFERIGFQLQDDYSLFPDDRRRLFLPVTRAGSGRYELDTVVYLDAPFGVLADCYDQMRPGGMRQSVYQLTLLIDDIPYFESVLDSLPFEIGPVVNLVFDPTEAVNDEKRVRRLFDRTRQVQQANLSFCRRGGGGYGRNMTGGVHEGLIVGEDSWGNRAELGFRFMIAGQDSAASLHEKPNYQIFEDKSLQIVDYHVCEDGLITCVTAGRESGCFFLRPVLPIQSSINEQDLAMLLHEGQLQAAGVQLEVVGWGRDDLFSADGGLFRVSLPPNTLYRPRIMAVEKMAASDSLQPFLASDIYRLQPEAFPVRHEFEVSIKLDPGDADNLYTGLCWYDKSEEEWVWIDEDTAHADLAAGPSFGGGLFAALIDTTAPTITGLNLKQGHKYTNEQPPVKFVLEDNLSGFEDDRSIDIRIDGQWLLPELDIESGDFVATLRKPLELGRHVLTVWVVDRAGNRTERRVEFDIIKGGK